MSGGGRERKEEALHNIRVRSQPCTFDPEWNYFFFPSLTVTCILPSFMVKPHPQGSCTPLMVATLHPQAAAVPMAAQYPLPLALGSGLGRPSLLEQTATVLVKRDPRRTPATNMIIFHPPTPVLSLAIGINLLSSFSFLLPCIRCCIKAKLPKTNELLRPRFKFLWTLGAFHEFHDWCILPL